MPLPARRTPAALSSSVQLPDKPHTTEITISGNTITGNLPENDLPVLRQFCDADTTINGWTPGEMFTIKADADNIVLPDLPSDATNIFLGWSTVKDGTTAVLKAGEKAEKASSTTPSGRRSRSRGLSPHRGFTASRAGRRRSRSPSPARAMCSTVRPSASSAMAPSSPT